MIKWTVVLVMVLIAEPLSGQSIGQYLTLEQAYEQLYISWPLAEKADIERRASEWNRRIAESGRYPELRLSASASYRSDVTEVPFSSPGSEPPIFSKDHYNLSMELNQTIFDGGKSRILSELEDHKSNATQAEIRSEFLNVQNQMAQVWYGVLILQKQEESLQIMSEDLTNQLSVIQSKVRNGILLPGNEWSIQAEIIRIEQELSYLQGDIKAGYGVLGEMLGMDLSPDIELKLPEASEFERYTMAEIVRPEYDLFDANLNRIDSQKRLATSDVLPSVGVFATSAYGRPGLNVFDDDLQFYWIVGVRAQWSFRKTRTANMRNEMLDLQKRSIDRDRNQFTRMVQSELIQSEEEIHSLDRQMKQDQKLLQLRNDIVKEKKSQLDNGVINATEYITELHAENRARINLQIRKIRYKQAVSEYKTKKGYLWNQEY